ncbi:condensation domain-containing protein, partial [Methylogaea oryzae]
MKPLRDFLAQLEAKDIRLWLEGDGLRFRAPKDALTADLRQELATRKQEVIAALAQAGGPEPIAPLPEGADIPISYAQQRLWFLAGMERDSPVYNVFACYVAAGALNAKALENALADLVRRHHSLRMCFPEVEGKAAVRLLEAYAPLQIDDLSHLSGATQRQALDRHVESLSHFRFDLATGPLFQARLLVLGNDRHALLFAMHHIISDGWSMSLMYQELSQLYTAYSRDETPALAPLSIHYGDYAAWQRRRLSGATLDALLDYWRGQLDGAPELLALPTDRPRPPVMSYRGGHFQTRLAPDAAQQLRALSRQQGCTLFMTLLAAFYLLLARYSGQRDIVVGVPIANRTQPQTHGLIGFFVNTLVMRTVLGEEQSFLDLLQQVRQTAIGAYDHQELPFETLVERLNPERSLAYAPLFQVTFSLLNEPMEQLQLPQLRVEPLPDRTIVPYSKFDLGLLLMEQKDGLLCTWEYAADLFDGATVERMARRYETLLQAILQDPGRCIDDLPLLPPEEAARIQAWNRRAA